MQRPTAVAALPMDCAIADLGQLSAMRLCAKPGQDVRGALRHLVQDLDATAPFADHSGNDSPRCTQDDSDLSAVPSHASLARNRVGKPMRRFSSAVPPRASRTVLQLPDALYLPVEQLDWEQDIVWGDAPCLGPAPAMTLGEDTLQCPRNAGRATRSTRLHHDIDSSRSCTPQPLEAALEVPFDMTRPRTYRWEVPPYPGQSSRSEPPSSLACPLNPSLDDGAWLDAVAWDCCLDMPPSQIILDVNDAHIVLISSPAKRPPLHIPRRPVGIFERRLEARRIEEPGKEGRLRVAIDTLAFDDATAAVAANERTTTHRRRRHHMASLHHMASVHHSVPAMQLAWATPELSPQQLRDLHRRRGTFCMNERLVIAPASDATPAEAAPVLTASDLNPTRGGKLLLLEYVEQNPPVLSRPGMASRLLHYWRPSSEAPAPPSVELGDVVTLDANDDTPFLGDVPAGTVVSSLHSNLAKIPIFQHRPRASMLEAVDDFEYFLLVRTFSGTSKRGATALSLMELPPVFVAGQVEPQMEVPAPGSRAANNFVKPYMSLHVLRLFKEASNGGEHILMDAVQRLFPSQSVTAVRKCLKELATFKRDAGGWTQKAAHERVTDDAVRAMLTPESVCLYESHLCGLRRLVDMGLSQLTSSTDVAKAIQQLTTRLRDRQKQLQTRVLDGFSKRELKQALFALDPVVRKLKHDIQIARSIELQLERTPWQWTRNYIECHLQGKGMLQLTGDGDPSACGEGFSFLRAPVKRGELSTSASLLSGTSADLRKLKMKQAGDVLRAFGMDDAAIQKLPRWDRIAMIRTLSIKGSQRGDIGLDKFVRGGRKSLHAQHQAYLARCDQRYRAQIDALSSDQVIDDQNDRDSDDDVDLEHDVFGANGDDLVTARPTTGLHNLFTKDGNRSQRSALVLQARDDAAELENLKRDMADTSGGSRHGSSSSSRSTRLFATLLTQARAAATASPPAERRQAIKRVTRTVHEDGTETVKIEFIVDPTAVQLYTANAVQMLKMDQAAKVSRSSDKSSHAASGSSPSSASTTPSRPAKQQKRRHEISASLDEHGARKRSKQSFSRLPIARLHAYLENVFYQLIAMPESVHLRDSKQTEGGATMDLQRMRRKLSDLAYDSVESFVNDIALMATSAVLDDDDTSDDAGSVSQVVAKATEALLALDDELRPLERQLRARRHSTLPES
ncbi:hypothetical protein SPRG_19617 [Saprolegnia parasitica CBS 223.65]|uniref:Transcription initiation factor TFIID subunit 1 histone acetyltransferase domain-containing protein n=1 Tax=Saprolegnia parasitica (strain CBS 223.65) TaxID=695850 RepID=A0A067CPC9_SAPPC|nr:hypothetical protein SPRG_19617 [Saprolegnia parasitica CBS 223.65]KDO31095.1 hypothetical protein SPRG_19617 [Saprolegnia parasitica CBS 223.65]|eukprot:XP_012198346.1 hypothetical protein SPRG_19617 [Saprolegnia parasitica CBS 223.65]